MSADSVGARLLAEVHEESLHEVRHIEQPNLTDVLGIPAIDRILETTRPIPSQINRQPGWLSHRDEEQGQSDEGKPPEQRTAGGIPPNQAPAVVQIISSSSHTDHTDLLYYAAASAVSPRSFHGKESVVVWLNCSGRFSAMRLHRVILTFLDKESHRRDGGDSPKTETNHSLARIALQHVHVQSPVSSAALLSTLECLPESLFEINRLSGDRRVGLVVLDSTSAFFWQDRFEADMARLESDPTSTTAPNPIFSRTKDIISALKSLQQQYFYSCPILLGTPAVSPPTRRRLPKRSSGLLPPNIYPSNQPAPPPQEPAAPQRNAWTQFAMLTLLVTRLRVPQFAEAMMPADCARNATARLLELRKGRHRATVMMDWRAGQDSTVDLAGNDAEGVGRMRMGGAMFEFWATELGVEIEV